MQEEVRVLATPTIGRPFRLSLDVANRMVSNGSMTYNPFNRRIYDGTYLYYYNVDGTLMGKYLAAWGNTVTVVGRVNVGDSAGRAEPLFQRALRITYSSALTLFLWRRSPSPLAGYAPKSSMLGQLRTRWRGRCRSTPSCPRTSTREPSQWC